MSVIIFFSISNVIERLSRSLEVFSKLYKLYWWIIIHSLKSHIWRHFTWGLSVANITLILFLSKNQFSLNFCAKMTHFKNKSKMGLTPNYENFLVILGQNISGPPPTVRRTHKYFSFHACREVRFWVPSWARKATKIYVTARPPAMHRRTRVAVNFDSAR